MDLDIAPLFADDGVLAGRSGEVLRALKHMKVVMPMVGLRSSQLQPLLQKDARTRPGWQFRSARVPRWRSRVLP